MGEKSWAEIAYEAYCDAAGGKSLVSGTDLPPWGALPGEIQAAWAASAHAVAEDVTRLIRERLGIRP